MREKYTSPFVSFIFQRLFGKELGKDLLRDFLNEILNDNQYEIETLTYLKVSSSDILSVCCENKFGENFIVELQKSKHNFFKNREGFLSSFSVYKQAESGLLDTELIAIFTIGILDFEFNEDKGFPDKFRYDLKFRNTETQKTFYEKLTLIYFELPKFTKPHDNIETRLEKWLYLLKKLPSLLHLPESMQEQTFERVLELTEQAKFSHEEHLAYERSLMYYRDMNNAIATARQEGIEAGKKKAAKHDCLNELTRNAIKAGLNTDTISAITGLEKSEIEQLRNK